MKKLFSKKWKSSKQPRKQRKYLANAPLHIKRKFMSATLSKGLRNKFKRRSIKIRKGDKVKILRGQFKKKEGIIVEISLKKSKVDIDIAQMVKRDGSKVYYPIHPSNLMVTELNLDDKLRKNMLERKDGPLKKTKSA